MLFEWSTVTRVCYILDEVTVEFRRVNIVYRNDGYVIAPETKAQAAVRMTRYTPG